MMKNKIKKNKEFNLKKIERQNQREREYEK